MTAATRIILAGFGGQGILSAGRIIADAALLEGKDVSWFPSYGPEMRGGTANCAVIVSSGPIGSPVLDECDALVALSGPAFEKFAPRVRREGILIADSSMVRDALCRTDIRCHRLAASETASAFGHMALATVMLLGRLSAVTGCFSRDSFEQALRRTLPERRHDLIPANLKIFDSGYANGRVRNDTSPSE